MPSQAPLLFIRENMAKKKDDLPAIQWYTGDWFKAGDVRSLTVEQRGIWFDMLNYMWESNERGYLVDASGKPYTTEELSRMIGMTEDLLKQNLKQMESKKIFSVRESDGAIYCRRMVRDEEIRRIRKEVGKIGGNRNKEKNLLKQNDKQSTKQITEDEVEDENEDNTSLMEGGTGETDLAGTTQELPKLNYFEMQTCMNIPEKFLPNWRLWVDHCAAEGKPLTRFTAISHLKTLREISIDLDVGEVIERTIDARHNSFQFIIEKMLKGKNGKTYGQNSPISNGFGKNRDNGRRAVGDFDTANDGDYQYETFKQSKH